MGYQFLCNGPKSSSDFPSPKNWQFDTLIRFMDWAFHSIASTGNPAHLYIRCGSAIAVASMNEIPQLQRTQEREINENLFTMCPCAEFHATFIHIAMI